MALFDSTETGQRVVDALGRVETKLSTTATTLAEFGDRITSLEQRNSSHPFPAGEALIKPSGKPDIIKVHNSGGDPLFIVGSKAKVADVLPVRKAEISLGRYLAAGLLGEKCRDPEALAYVADTKSVSTATSGLIIPTEYQGEWIDRLRANMVLVSAGAQTVPMVNKTHTAAALLTDPTAGWHTEATADINASDPTFVARTLTARTVAVRCTASVEVTQDSPNFGDQLAAAMTRSIAQEIDRVGLVGSGVAPEPLGLYGTSGINEVASVGTIADYSKVLSGVQLLLESNVPLEVATANAIMSPRTWARFENLATGIASDKTQLPRPRSLENSRFHVTSAVPNTQSTDKSCLFLGDFRDLVMGIRTETEVRALQLTTFASSLIVEFIAFARVDFVAVRPASFAVLKGIA